MCQRRGNVAPDSSGQVWFDMYCVNLVCPCRITWFGCAGRRLQERSANVCVKRKGTLFRCLRSFSTERPSTFFWVAHRAFAEGPHRWAVAGGASRRGWRRFGLPWGRLTLRARNICEPLAEMFDTQRTLERAIERQDLGQSEFLGETRVFSEGPEPRC